MPSLENSQSLSESLRKAFHCGKDKVTIQEVFESAAARGFGFLFVLISIPIALPITPPGIPIPFGILLTLGFIQLISGRKVPYIPKWIAQRKLPAGENSKFVKLLLWLIRVLERLTKERPWGMFGKRRIRFGLAPIGLIFSIAIINPVSQLTWLPAIGVLLLGMAFLESDGLMAILGILIGLIGLGVITGIIYGFWFGASRIIDEEAMLLLFRLV